MKNSEQWVRPAIRALAAYQVPSAKGLIKLDAMENPYQLPAQLRAEWLQQLATVSLNRYPDPECVRLKRRLRTVMAVPEQCDIIVGNGSDELIQMIAMLVGGAGRTLAAPAPSFAMYRLISTITSTKFVELPLQSDFSADAKKFVNLITASQPCCVFLAYPNNPTGNSFDTALIEQVIAAAPGLVIVDEAYHSFSGKSLLKQVAGHPNLLVMRTLSKSGLAGLRLGMVVGSPEWIGQLEKIRLPYNVNSLTQISAEFCLQQQHILVAQSKQIVADRQKLFDALQQMPGLTAYPSDANFILIRLDTDFDATLVHHKLKQHGVLVKNLHQCGLHLDNCLRITVGTDAQNRQFLSALEACLVPQTRR